MGLTALCPGTFDPVTNGHLDIIGRTSATFDAVVVGVLGEPVQAAGLRRSRNGRPCWTRRAPRCSNVSASAPFSGLLVAFAKDARGDGDREGPSRAVSDYEYEIQMAQMNLRLGGCGDPLHAHEPEVVVPVVLAGERGRSIRRSGRGVGPRPRSQATD